MKALIIDEHPAILQGLKCSLSDESIFRLRCVGDLKNANLPKDVLVSDIIVLGIPHHLPELFDSIRRIRAINASVPVLIYGVDKDSPVIERLMLESVQGIVTVQYDFSKLGETLMKTIRHSGLDPLQFGFKYSRYSDFSTNDLSQREMEIVYLISEEKTTNEISRQLNITISTVENHRKNIFRKMGARNLAGMIMNATKAGYIA